VAWLSDWWNSVSGTVLQGLGITVVGMALVFFTLGLVILAMVLLTRLPWLRGGKTAPDSVPAAPQRTDTDTPATSQEDDLGRVAAIAVAILRSRRRTPLRSRAPARRSTWKSYGRAHQLGL
jgi:sodium pump decarboxylase gamma subunit